MNLYYPPAIANEDHRPMIVFKNSMNNTEGDTHIFLPAPQSIQFSDSASYNSSEIGFGGSAVLNAGRSQSAGDALNNTINQGANALPKDFKSIAHLLASKTAPQNIQSAIGIATGTTLNRNIVTEFSSVGTRQFSFQFKLMSTSAAESDIIKNIGDSFRSGLYPEGNTLQLSYPPTWYINFIQRGTDIKHLPKIFETYLTSMSTNFNSSMNLFHADGSPVEIDISLSFTETRALTKDDIESLKERAFMAGDFERIFSKGRELISTDTQSTNES